MEYEFINILIIGGGISGLTLAASLQKKNISFVLFEKDESFDCRHGGYSLTMQNFGQYALECLDLRDKLYSLSCRSSFYHTLKYNGETITKYGKGKIYKNKGNVPIPRQLLRKWIMELIPNNNIKWNKKVNSVSYSPDDNKPIVKLSSRELIKCNLLVSADGTFSKIRKLICPNPPLQFLGYIIVNGITKSNFSIFKNGVTQWLDGKHRIFTKPFINDEIMWQLSFPMDTNEMKEYFTLDSNKSNLWIVKESNILNIMFNKAKNIVETWDIPIQKLINKTNPVTLRVGPLYDREPTLENINNPIVFIGDSAHPMTPFKGQGANTAMIDAIELSNLIENNNLSSIHELLPNFQYKCMKRASKYVLESREKTIHLHTKEALIT